MGLTYVAPDQPFHLVFTGEHARGNVVLPDGTSYDVSPAWIEVQSPEHAGLVSHLIGEQHEAAGRLGLSTEVVTDPETGAVVSAPHQCTDHCGVLAKTAAA